MLISGGIDSCVAAYRILRTGNGAEFVLFYDETFVPPKEKEITINALRQIKSYLKIKKKFKLHIVHDGSILSELVKKCERKYLTILYRRFMVRIAERIAKQVDAKALVTGDSVGQVASQTIENLKRVDEATKLHVIRPLLGFDKIETIKIAEKIGTYKFSKYHKCCGVTPPNPRTKARKEEVEKEESKLNIEELINNALKTRDVVLV